MYALKGLGCLGRRVLTVVCSLRRSVLLYVIGSVGSSLHVGKGAAETVTAALEVGDGESSDGEGLMEHCNALADIVNDVCAKTCHIL